MTTSADKTQPTELTPGEKAGNLTGSIFVALLLIPWAAVLIAISIRIFCFILHCQHLLP